MRGRIIGEGHDQHTAGVAVDPQPGEGIDVLGPIGHQHPHHLVVRVAGATEGTLERGGQVRHRAAVDKRPKTLGRFGVGTGITGRRRLVRT